MSNQWRKYLKLFCSLWTQALISDNVGRSSKTFEIVLSQIFKNFLNPHKDPINSSQQRNTVTLFYHPKLYIFTPYHKGKINSKVLYWQFQNAITFVLTFLCLCFIYRNKMNAIPFHFDYLMERKSIFQTYDVSEKTFED